MGYFSVLDDELPEITSRARFHLYSNGYEDSISTEDTKNTSPVEMNESKVDKIYTVGCFDLFHRGHKRLLMNMRNLGKEVSALTVTIVLMNFYYR